MKPRRRKREGPPVLEPLPAAAPDEHGLPLDELTQAYADLIARGDDPYNALPDPDILPLAAATDEMEDEAEEPLEDEEKEDVAAEPEAAESEAACEVSPRTILEAMLFVGDRSGAPLAPARAAELMRGVSPEEIPGLVDQLNRRYAADGCPYQIVSEGPGYRMALRREFHGLRNRFHGRAREARLSQASLDVLAIVAYRQPVAAEEVSRLRGTPCGVLLTQLVRRQLLRIQRPEGKRHPVQYLTTDRFLELFGLQSLTDLPQSEEP